MITSLRCVYSVNELLKLKIYGKNEVVQLEHFFSRKFTTSGRIFGVNRG